MDIVAWFNSHMPLIIGILSAIVALDHVLAMIPSVEASSTFQMVSGLVSKIYGYLVKQQPPIPPPSSPS